MTAQSEVRLDDLVLLQGNADVARALEVLKENGVTTGEQFDILNSIQPTKQATRQAKRIQLDELVKTNVGQLLANHELPYMGHTLDTKKRGKTNFEVLKAEIDQEIKTSAPSGATKRSELSSQDLDYLITTLPEICKRVEAEVIGG